MTPDWNEAAALYPICRRQDETVRRLLVGAVRCARGHVDRRIADGAARAILADMQFSK